MKREVLRFISRFTLNGRRDQVIESFTCGCCYWFAKILYERFCESCVTEIVYDQTENHFGCRIDYRVYDIQGDVTNKYHWGSWPISEDPVLTGRIRRDCIAF